MLKLAEPIEAPAATSAGEPAPVVPAPVAAVLRAESGASIAEIVTAIQNEVAEYTRPLDPAYGRTLSQAAEHAVRTFIERVAHPAHTPRPAHPAHPDTEQAAPIP